MRKLAIAFFLIVALQAPAQRRSDSVGTLYTTRQTPVHDPVMIREGNSYYIFSTGFGINVYTSKDMKTWRKENPVFSQPPQWAVDTVKGYRGHTWAPDISFYKGYFYLFYSVSTFGKNRSAIGLAKNKTLDPMSGDFGWIDLGPVIQSVPGLDNWNAIDPNLIFDAMGVPWLSFGSFWSGLKMFKLDSTLSRPSEPLMLETIAVREQKTIAADSSENKAIEAPFIFRKRNYFYLFASWDYCCRGEKSNYKVVVGRSERATGPFLDRKGFAMHNGGGTVFIEGDAKEWFGIGHNAVFTDEDGTDYFIAHGYDGLDKGRSKLIIKKIMWDKEGWPMLHK